MMMPAQAHRIIAMTMTRKKFRWTPGICSTKSVTPTWKLASV